MANKYIIHGATYDGDGTGSNEAASAGAAGAWNNINKFTGTALTYGSLSSGDTVYIRGKSSAGADVTVTYGVNTNLGKSGLSGAQRVKWILDNGTVWSGVTGGVLTIQATAAVSASLLACNTLEAKDSNAIVFNVSGVSSSTADLLKLYDGCLVIKSRFDNSSVSTNGPRVAMIGSTSGAGGEATLEDCSWVSAVRYQALIVCNEYNLLHVINPDIEITSTSETDPVFSAQRYGASIRVLGGRLHGAGVFSGLALCVTGTQNGGCVELLGFQFDKSVLVAQEPPTGSPTVRVASIGADAAMGSVSRDWAATFDTRDYVNLPYLNAATPGAAPVSWSLKVQPSASASGSRTVRVPTVAKMFEDTAAALTITQELLVETGFTEIDAETAYLLVAYTDDSTGLPKYYSSRASGSLTTSTASWSATTYGAESFNKCKIEVTTPTSVKQYTPVFTQLIIETPASIATKYLIVCPDVQLA